MKLLSIFSVLFYVNSSNEQSLKSYANLIIPRGFNITSVKTFKGFNATHFDGKELNPFQFDLNDVFARFKVKYNKAYTAKEVALRKENIRKRLVAIAKHILDSETNPTTFNVGLNHLSDRTEEEYLALLGTRLSVFNKTIAATKMQIRSTINDAVCQPKTTKAIPKSFDWRTEKIVTSVKDQGQCGSCWAFASTAAIESQWAKKTSQLIDLSEQDLVNCASNSGCNGDSIDTAYNFVKNNGEARETAAPYSASTQCKHYPISNGVKIDDYCRKGGTYVSVQTVSNGKVKQSYKLEDNPDAKIQRDIMENGPVAGALCASYLQSYSSGIFNLANCPKSIDHGVLIVGWGTDNGIDYWIVKNSWSPSWGENGYFRIIRGKNMCGINTVYYYPLLANATPFNKSN